MPRAAIYATHELSGTGSWLIVLWVQILRGHPFRGPDHLHFQREDALLPLCGSKVTFDVLEPRRLDECLWHLFCRTCMDLARSHVQREVLERVRGLELIGDVSRDVSRELRLGFQDDFRYFRALNHYGLCGDGPQ